MRLISKLYKKYYVEKKTKPIKKRLSIEEQLKKDFALFDKAGGPGLQIDLVKALREDRDRDNA